MADTKHADLATKSKDLRVQLVDSIISMMEDNDRLFWTDGLSPSAFTPVNGTSNRPYNGFNRIMLALEANSKGYQDPRWCTYRQASKKGWQVKRGEHGSKIEFWKTYRIPLDADDNPVKSAKDPDFDHYSQSIPKLSGLFTVFNYSQIEGPEPYSPPPAPPVSDVAKALKASSRCPILPSGDDMCYYSPADDEIHMASHDRFKTDTGYVATLAHEMAHSTMAPAALDRAAGTGAAAARFGSEAYAAEELRAEFASVFTQASLGVEIGHKNVENHAAYIQSWIRAAKKDPETMIGAIRDADKISDYLVDRYCMEAEKMNRDLICERVAELGERLAAQPFEIGLQTLFIRFDLGNGLTATYNRLADDGMLAYYGLTTEAPDALSVIAAPLDRPNEIQGPSADVYEQYVQAVSAARSPSESARDASVLSPQRRRRGARQGRESRSAGHVPHDPNRTGAEQEGGQGAVAIE
jgi:antirestriction protein ArdC